MLEFTLRPLNEAGRMALAQHLEEEKKLPFRIRFLYTRSVKEQMDGDNLVLTVHPRTELTIDVTKFEANIMEAMAKNGAIRTKDYEIIRRTK